MTIFCAVRKLPDRLLRPKFAALLSMSFGVLDIFMTLVSYTATSSSKIFLCKKLLITIL